MKFNWHDLNHDSFLSWMIVNLLTGNKDELYETLSDATDSFKNIDLKISISGIEVDVDDFINSIQANMSHMAESAAKEELSKIADLVHLEQAVNNMQNALKDKITNFAQTIGLDLDKDDYD